jgi:hypothetical protein
MASRTGINVDIIQTKLLFFRNYSDNAAPSTANVLYCDGSGGTYWSSLYIENVPGFSSYYASTIGLCSTLLFATTYGLSSFFNGNYIPGGVYSTIAGLGTLGYISSPTLAKSLQSTVQGIYNYLEPEMVSSVSTLTRGIPSRKLAVNINSNSFEFLSSSKKVAGFDVYGNLGLGMYFPSTSLDVSGSAIFRSPGGVYIDRGGSLAVNKSYRDIINAELDVSGNILTNNLFCSGAGTFNGSVTAASYLTSSDSNYKTNIKTYNGKEHAWSSLRGVSFKWKETGEDDIGFIAQELLEVVPESVSANSNGRYYIEPTKLMPLLVETIKTMKEQIAVLELRVAALEKH